MISPSHRMLKPIIDVRGLSKVYYIDQIGASTLRNEFQRFIGRLKGAANQRSRRDEEGQFWALKDVSFDVEAG